MEFYRILEYFQGKKIIQLDFYEAILIYISIKNFSGYNNNSFNNNKMNFINLLNWIEKKVKIAKTNVYVHRSLPKFQHPSFLPATRAKFWIHAWKFCRLFSSYVPSISFRHQNSLSLIIWEFSVINNWNSYTEVNASFLDKLSSLKVRVWSKLLVPAIINLK